MGAGRGGLRVSNAVGAPHASQIQRKGADSGDRRHLGCVFKIQNKSVLLQKMEFYNENGAKIDHLRYERTEQLQAEQYIRPTSIVLEIGARYGSVSCIISKKLENPMNLVAVEPDERVWSALEGNMARNGCIFHIVKGVVSRKPLILTETSVCQGYGTTSVPVETSSIPNYTLEEIESQYGLRFNTLVADCEGFLETFFDENPGFYDQLSLIMFEKDYPHKCNYNKIIQMLREKGFRQIVGGFHEVWEKE